MSAALHEDTNTILLVALNEDLRHQLEHASTLPAPPEPHSAASCPNGEDHDWLCAGPEDRIRVPADLWDTHPDRADYAEECQREADEEARREEEDWYP